MLIAALRCTGCAGPGSGLSLGANFVEDVSNAGTSAAAFLQIGVGARAMAMGNAGTTLVRDATVLYWNPAAAANLPCSSNSSPSITPIGWLTPSWIIVGMVFRVPGAGTLGISVLAFDAVDNQPVRTILATRRNGGVLQRLRRDVRADLCYVIDQQVFGRNNWEVHPAKRCGMKRPGRWPWTLESCTRPE